MPLITSAALLGAATQASPFIRFLDWGNGLLWNSLLIYLLVGAGLFFTVATRGAQLRLFGEAWKAVLGSRQGSGEGISSFQAFATGLASRVGTGNIAGVAIALTLGGPGAVFWMWVTALVGMSTALIEATLAQAYKVPDAAQGFRGGPAYYMQLGLGQKWMGNLFAAFLILAFGLVFNAVQSNSIVAAAAEAYHLPPLPLGIVLAALTAPIIFGGLKRVSKVAELVVPVMALLYILLAVYVLITHAAQIPAVFTQIFQSAFGLQAAAGGVAGGLMAALLNGVKRGLFSNEAGMGSAPNAAAAADVDHPVQQGLVQMLGVFVDTILICTATALIILMSGVPLNTKQTGVQLTQNALSTHVGAWGNDFLAVAIFLFAFTSIIGNYAYAEGNVRFLTQRPAALLVFRLAVLGMVIFGALKDVPTVWDMADFSMGLMAVTNLVALLLLAPTALRLLRDYDRQRRAARQEPVFNRRADPALDKKLPEGAWK